MTNLTRYALISADPVYRPDLLNILASEEGLRIVPKEDSDHTTPLTDTSTVSLIEQMVHEGLGPHTVLASEVNGERGALGVALDRRRSVLADDPEKAL